MIHKCPICGDSLLVSKMIEEAGENKGKHPATCLKCKYKTYVNGNH